MPRWAVDMSAAAAMPAAAVTAVENKRSDRRPASNTIDCLRLRTCEIESNTIANIKPIMGT
jgi:hypothetical protein